MKRIETLIGTNKIMKTKPLTFEQENKIVMLVIKNAMAMKKFLSLILFLLIFSSASFSENYKFQKLVDLKNPWGHPPSHPGTGLIRSLE